MVNLSRENFSFDPNVIIGQFIPNIAQLPSDVSLKKNTIHEQLGFEYNFFLFLFAFRSY